MIKIKYFIFTIMLIVALSCRHKPQETEQKDGDKTRENLIKINKYLVDKDIDIIKGYVKRRNWNMKVSQTGLWYMIYENGSGKKAISGEKASIKYRISLLDGTICYTSDKDGPKTFTIGKGGVETGLEEGILLMKEGDKARFIMLPYLAHGLVGDDNLIPARSTILYEVELIKISE